MSSKSRRHIDPIQEALQKKQEKKLIGFLNEEIKKNTKTLQGISKSQSQKIPLEKKQSFRSRNQRPQRLRSSSRYSTNIGGKSRKNRKNKTRRKKH